MTWTGCEETTWWLTWALRQEQTRIRVETAFAEGAPLDHIVDLLVADLDPAVGLQVRHELAELPSAVTESILAAWRQATAASKPFELASIRPSSPLDLARQRSVRLAVDVNEEGVRAELTHIGSRHPTWIVGPDLTTD